MVVVETKGLEDLDVPHPSNQVSAALSPKQLLLLVLLIRSLRG